MSVRHEVPSNEAQTSDTGALTPTLDLEIFESLDMDNSATCDHQDHTHTGTLHADGNEHYIRVVAPCGHHQSGTIFVVCWQWIMAMRSWIGVRCAECGDIQPFDVANKVLGPVKDYLK